MKRIAIIFILSIPLLGCPKTSNQAFTGLFNGTITPNETNNGGGNNPSGSIQVITTATITSASNSPVAVGDIAYDGTRLLILDTAGGSPIADNVSFDYISPALAFQTTSTTNYSNATISPVIESIGPSAGESALVWTSGGSSTLTVRDDSNGTVVSTTSINFQNYGCNSDSAVLTYCSGNYYGACETSSGYMRFFSFNSSGTLQSGVTTTISSATYGSLNGMTCYNGSYLLLATNATAGNNYTPYYKYDLSFNLVSTDTTNTIDSGSGIATDGNYLYLMSSLNNGANPPTYTLTQATLGNLK